MIFNINFFLFCFAQSNIFSYTFVYAKHYANVTGLQFGTFATILPLLLLFAKPTACSITDARGIHKQFLMGSLAVFGLSYGALAIIPFFKDPEDHENDTLAWLIIAPLMALGYVANGCVNCMNDALASNYARKHNKNYARMRIFACVGYASGALLLMSIGDVEGIPFRVPGCIILFIAAMLDITILFLWPYPEDFEMFHDGSTAEQRKLSIMGPNTAALLAQKKPRGSISKDMLEKIRAGRSKSVGHLPKPARDLATQTGGKPAKEEKKKEYSNFQCQMMLMKMISGDHRSFARYIFLFILLGFVQASIWNFELDFLEKRMARDRDEFEFISALCMIIQAAFADLFTMIVADGMIRTFGSNALISLCLVCAGLRCFIYCNLVPYLRYPALVAAELLQGPSMGMYWVLIVDVGSNYALMVSEHIPALKRRGVVRDRKHEEELSGCLRATMIGIMSSSTEALGIGLGSLAGGSVLDKFGYEVIWNSCAVVGISVGFLNIWWDIWRKLITNSGNSKYKEAVKGGIPVVKIDEIPSKLSDGTKL